MNDHTEEMNAATAEALSQDVELPINVLVSADARPYQFGGHEVVALVIQAVNLESGTAAPYLVFIAPEDAGPLGRRLVSVASPLKPVNKKGSAK